MMTEGKNNSSEPNQQPENNRFDQELLKGGLRCDLDQYEMLKRCSEKKDMTEWNKWREENKGGEIWLQGAILDFAELQGANLGFAKLQGDSLSHANLQGADLYSANLQGAKLQYAHLQGAEFTKAIVNGSSNFLGCEIDEDTDFCNTALENVQIEAGTKILLKYNIRRMNWKDWYWGSGSHKVFNKHCNRPPWRACCVLCRLLITSPTRLFWKISNYGISTLRIIAWFFVLALFFAAIYSNCVCWWPPGVVSNLTVEPQLPLWHYFLLVLLRPVYFSIVTMTTLGFGDMYANAQSVWGHILLIIQVILGYVLLGALVTRLAVLFTSDGPAGSFTKMDKETKKLLAKLEEEAVLEQEARLAKLKEAKEKDKA